MSDKNPEKARATTPSPLQTAELETLQYAAKLGVQVQGATANASALSEMWNSFQTKFNQYQNQIGAILAESDSLKAENKALHQTVTELKEKLVKQDKSKPKAETQKPTVSKTSTS